jgi:hypothetical protein
MLFPPDEPEDQQQDDAAEDVRGDREVKGDPPPVPGRPLQAKIYMKRGFVLRNDGPQIRIAGIAIRPAVGL